MHRGERIGLEPPLDHAGDIDILDGTSRGSFDEAFFGQPAQDPGDVGSVEVPPDGIDEVGHPEGGMQRGHGPDDPDRLGSRQASCVALLPGLGVATRT